MTPVRQNGKIVITNVGIGSARSIRLVPADELPGISAEPGVDLGPGKEITLAVKGDPAALAISFTKYGKERRATLPVVAAQTAPGTHGQQAPGTAVEAAKLDAIHADVQIIKNTTGLLPGAIVKLGAGVEIVQRHVRGVPFLQTELAEARLVPEALALEIQNKIADILTVEEQAIWRAVRNADGSQKDALPSLRQSGIVNSTPTLSRRVSEINIKLRENGLPPCDASGPAIRFTKSGGHENDEGRTHPEELSPVERDWAEDPTDRDTTIGAYLAASAADKAFFHKTKPGIEEESKKYMKRFPMKSA
jgi:hypothetical protein